MACIFTLSGRWEYHSQLALRVSYSQSAPQCALRVSSSQHAALILSACTESIILSECAESMIRSACAESTILSARAESIHRGSSTSLLAQLYFFWQETLIFEPFLKHKKMDRQATKGDTIFDNPRQHIHHTCSLLPANQSYYAMISMLIAIKW